MKTTASNFLNRFLKVLVITSLLAFLPMGVAFTTQTRADFMPLNQIQEGMEGIGKTVVQRSQISDFQVKVVEVIDEPGWLKDFIIIRASGEAIKRPGYYPRDEREPNLCPGQINWSLKQSSPVE